MRLLRLDLEKYGAFEGRSLTFRPDARLHLVFGPNEAGKSSALSAVGDLLFGFGKTTPFAFRHANRDLRLGAVVANAAGEELRFRRRKGDKSTLVDEADNPLRDDLLLPFLGALGRETFESAFGLTSDALVRGGKDLLRSDGEAGASLFAAASGLRGLEDRRRAIEDEADALFRPQASTRRFNDEFRAYEAARRDVAANELGQTEWKRVNESIEALGERHSGLGEQLKALRTERARIERLSRAHRASAAVDEARRSLHEAWEGQELPPGGAEALARALDAAEAAAAAEARAIEARTAVEAELDGVAPDRAALDAAEAIESAHRDSGAYGTLQTDLPRVQRELDEREAALAALAARLGLGDASLVEAKRPTDAARADLRALIDEERERIRAAAAGEKMLAEERDRLLTLEAGTPEELLDPQPLREAFAALGPRLRALDLRDERAAEAGAEARILAEAAARLAPSISDLDALAGRPLPGAETIARFRADAEALGVELARAEDGLAKDRAEAESVASELRALASGGPIASPDAIRSARAARDAQWESLRAHLLGIEALDAAALARAAAAFDRASLEADRLADRLAQDAGRAAQEASLTRRLGDLEGLAESTEARLASLRGRLARARQDWTAQWEPCGVAPASLTEMEVWRREVAGLLERRERNARRFAEVAALDVAEAELRPELDALAGKIGLEADASARATALAARIAERLATIDERWRQAAETTAAAAELRRRIAALESESRTAETGAADRRALWAAACSAAGLGTDVSLAAAAASLAAWDEAPGLIDERDYRLKRIRGMRRDADAFSARVAALVDAVAQDLSDLPPDAAARRLNERLAVARAGAARRADAERRLEDARRAATLAEARADEERAAVAKAAAGVPAETDLRALVAGAEARERLKATLAERRAQLALVGERADEDALKAELDGFDPDAAPAAIEGLRAEEARVEAEDRQVYAELSAARGARDALGGPAAEVAAARQRAAGASLAATAREWAVLKVAGLLIGAALERARAADRNPTLERAAGLFRMLTGGAFSGFAQDFEKDLPVLVALRASGERVGVGGLSEGTRDQFYLALRLAALEDYAARAEPAPFVGDDLFASFDDERTAHGLAALAEIGESVQPILFTHHRAVADTALRTLGDKVDVIEIGAVSR